MKLKQDSCAPTQPQESYTIQKNARENENRKKRDAHHIPPLPFSVILQPNIFLYLGWQLEISIKLPYKSLLHEHGFSYDKSMAMKSGITHLAP